MLIDEGILDLDDAGKVCYPVEKPRRTLDHWAGW